MTPDLPVDRSQLRGLVLGHLRETLWSLADEIEEVGPGWVARTPSLPGVWALNQVHISAPASAEEVIALSDEVQAGLRFRHIQVEPEDTAIALAEALGGATWKQDREVLMTLMAPPAREVNAEAVVELSPPEAAKLMQRWLNEDFPGIDSSTLDQLDEYSRREGELWGERVYGILDETGVPAAVTKFRSRGGTAWVEDVYTIPEARNRGLARTLVTYATSLARSGGHDLTFILADDNDWPKRLYESIGFRPVGLTWTFHRASAAV